MKKILTTLVTLLAISQISYAQWSTGSGTVYTTTSTDKVGIGTTTPLANLHINGSGSVAQIIETTSGDNNSVGLSIKGGSTNANWAVGTNTSSTTGNADDFFIYKAAGTVGPKLIIKDNGYVGIGTRTPDAKLTVDGTIHSKEVIVDNSVFPDYVFESNYKLLSLKQLKTYIDKNHHLPEVPSAQEVAENGLKVGEMNALLLKKVEELTLYVIEKDKEIEQQRKATQSLQLQINKLTKRLKK